MPDDPGPSRATSRIAIDIRVAAADWRAAFDNPAAAIRKAVRAALKDEIPRGSVTGLSILLTDDAEMRKLNAGWRAKDKPTNVLSFPAEAAIDPAARSEEHTSELQSLMRISYAVFCLKKK